MVADLDIYRSARLLVDQHGEDALIFAAMQADKCLEAGDLVGKAVWMGVIRAIKELLDQKPPDDDINLKIVVGGVSDVGHALQRCFGNYLGGIRFWREYGRAWRKQSENETSLG